VKNPDDYVASIGSVGTASRCFCAHFVEVSCVQTHMLGESDWARDAVPFVRKVSNSSVVLVHTRLSDSTMRILLRHKNFKPYTRNFIVFPGVFRYSFHYNAIKAYGAVEAQLRSLFILSLDVAEWPNALSGRFAPERRDPLNRRLDQSRSMQF
jgi:hypothetical protein